MGVVPDWHSVLYYRLIPDRNTKQYIGISLVGGSGVLRTKGLECGSNGRIILGGGGACEGMCEVTCKGALGLFSGLLTACGGVVPSSV